MSKSYGVLIEPRHTSMGSFVVLDSASLKVLHDHGLVVDLNPRAFDDVTVPLVKIAALVKVDA